MDCWREIDIVRAKAHRIPLIVPAVFLVAMLAVASIQAALGEGGGRIGAAEAADRLQAGKLVLVDIRTPQEWRATGIPAGARRSDWWQDGGRRQFLRDIMAFTDGDRARPIAVICARGGRSSQAFRLLREQGFREVYDIGEGMLGSRAGPGWLARKLAVTPCPAC